MIITTIVKNTLVVTIIQKETAAGVKANLRNASHMDVRVLRDLPAPKVRKGALIETLTIIVVIIINLGEVDLEAMRGKTIVTMIDNQDIHQDKVVKIVGTETTERKIVKEDSLEEAKITNGEIIEEMMIGTLIRGKEGVINIGPEEISVEDTVFNVVDSEEAEVETMATEEEVEEI